MAGSQSPVFGTLKRSRGGFPITALVAVIPAGEQWSDGALRPCVEDWIGAGATLPALPGRKSPEARLAVAVFERFRDDLERVLPECSSASELIERGFAEDVAIAAHVGSSTAIPILRGDRYINEALAA